MPCVAMKVNQAAAELVLNSSCRNTLDRARESEKAMKSAVVAQRNG
jgi:hypothetical protein